MDSRLPKSDDKPEPKRCPRCGSYRWVYKGDRQVCDACGHE